MNKTTLYQDCPKCGISVRIPKRQVEFLGTPYYRWEWVNRVECPNCEEKHTYGDKSFNLPTKIKVIDPPPIKTKNGVLHAFRNREDNYVAINSDRVEFLDYVHCDKLWDTAIIFTEIGFDGDVEVMIDTYNEQDREQLEKNKKIIVKDEQTFERMLKRRIQPCEDCIHDPLIEESRKNDVICLKCGKSLCSSHMVLHLKNEHWIHSDKLNFALEKD